MVSKVSVVIPSFNESKSIKTCIESFLNSEYPRDSLEIIVADGGSTDGTVDIIKQLASENDNVVLLNNKRKITPAGLNLGIKYATGEYVLIASAHSFFPSDYITVLVKYIIALNADVVGSVMKTVPGNNDKKALAIATVLSNKFGVGNSHFRIGSTEPQIVDTVPFGLYRYSVYKVAGLYNEKLVRNHDIEFSKRLIAKGFKIYLLPSPVCYYYARDSFRRLAGNNFQNGFWNLITVFITKSFRSLSLRHYIPFLMIISLILPLFLSLIISPVFLFVSLGILISYMIFVLFSAVKAVGLSKLFYYTFFTYFVIHFSYGIGSFIGCMNLQYLFKARNEDN